MLCTIMSSLNLMQLVINDTKVTAVDNVHPPPLQWFGNWELKEFANFGPIPWIL